MSSLLSEDPGDLLSALRVLLFFMYLTTLLTSLKTEAKVSIAFLGWCFVISSQQWKVFFSFEMSLRRVPEMKICHFLGLLYTNTLSRIFKLFTK